MARARKHWRTVGGDWRGGRIDALTDTTMTITLQAESWCTAPFTVARAMHPEASLNGAVACRLANPGAPIADYLIAEVRPAQFCGGIDSTPDNPNVGAVAYDLTGESEYYEFPEG
jgi:hypothetical protein